MSREKLTIARIKAFTCPDGKQQAILRDVETTLAVLATATGTKTYIIDTTLNGKTLRQKIGTVETWPLDAARTEARRRQTLVDQGIDPREEKKERKAAAEEKKERERRAQLPALEAWAAYLEAKRPRWSERTMFDHLKISAEGGDVKTRGRRKGEGATTQPGILRPLLVQPLAKIDREAVKAWMEDNTHRATQAHLAYRCLRAFLNWCAEQPAYREQAHTDACAGRTVREVLPAQQAKDDCLTREQLRPWFAAVQTLPLVQSAYLQILLLTGARREELATLEWERVELQWHRMTIKDKVNKTRTIPITPYVGHLLHQLLRANAAPAPRRLFGQEQAAHLERWERSRPWVFYSNASASGRLVEPTIAYRRAIEAASLPYVSPHGLRRSFGTLAEWVECPTGISAQIMGHAPSALAEKHYRRRPIDLLHLWHSKIEAWILEQAGIEQPTEAPPLQLVHKAG